MADYKKRKELKEYLPHEEHWKLKSDRKSVEKQAAPATTAVTAELTTQTSEERKRSLSMELDAATPPSKKLNTENGENDETDSEVVDKVSENGETAAVE